MMMNTTTIEYRYHTLFDDEDIPVMAYNLETELAEKYETIIRTNIIKQLLICVLCADSILFPMKDPLRSARCVVG